VAAPRDPPEVLERFHANLDLVEVVARQIAREIGCVVELEDLLAMGHKGLLEAARRFDPQRGVTFRRYANYRVRGAMYDGIRTSAPLPRRIYARVRALEASLLLAESAVEDASSSALQGLAADPQAADERLSEHLADIATAMAVGLLSAPAGEGDSGLGAVDPSDSPEAIVANSELRALVVKAIDDLPEDERALVERHYLRGERFDHVAASLGLSKSWGSRLHARAIARLTKRLRSLV
jgi:RNA polymerase sigma factor FliA